MVSFECLAVYHRGEKFDATASRPAAASAAVRRAKSFIRFSRKETMPSLIQKAAIATRK